MAESVASMIADLAGQGMTSAEMLAGSE